MPPHRLPALLALLSAVALLVMGAPTVGRVAATPRNDTTLLTRAELFDAIGENASTHTADLYYVAENGTWFHAAGDGTVGTAAPDGAEIPRMADERYEVPPGDRPAYRWKVVSDDGCSTTFYDATNVSHATPFAIPGCAGRPTTTSAAAGTSSPNAARVTETAAGPQDGFGVLLTALGLLAASWLFEHR